MALSHQVLEVLAAIGQLTKPRHEAAIKLQSGNILVFHFHNAIRVVWQTHRTG